MSWDSGKLLGLMSAPDVTCRECGPQVVGITSLSDLICTATAEQGLLS